MEEFENDVREPENGSNGKKKHTALKILVPVLLVAALGAGVFFTVQKLSDKKAEKAALQRAQVMEVAEDTEEETEEVKPIETESERKTDSAVSLTKKDGNVSVTDSSKGAVVVDVSEIVENVMPSVVAVTDTLEYTSVETYNPYNYFFGGDLEGSPETEEVPANGSGVIISESDTELLIVTNDHVIDNSATYYNYTVSSKGITVTFADGSTADATVKGTDVEADLAVIAVKLDDISAETMRAIRIAVIGNSDDIKIGSGVIAIGNAMGYGQSVTTGIISAKEREVTIDGITRKLMQTDAAINPGNSGGGLFNAEGELVGINSAKSVDTSVEGICFAIPITSAEDIIEELMVYEPIAEEDQGYLGINGETVPDNYVQSYGYPEGVSVTRIMEDSPAEKAGLQIYDIITEIDGRAVSTMESLKKVVNSHPAGDTIELTVQRPDGRNFKEIKIKVTLARYDDISESETKEEPKDDKPEKDDKSDEKPDDESGDEKKPDEPAKPFEGLFPDDGDEDKDNPFGSFFDWFFGK